MYPWWTEIIIIFIEIVCQITVIKKLGDAVIDIATKYGNNGPVIAEIDYNSSNNFRYLLIY